jgi:hypothetical protein
MKGRLGIEEASVFLDGGVRHFTLYFERDVRNLERFTLEVAPQVG